MKVPGCEISIPRLPADLIERDQWVLWRLEVRNGKPVKVPYQPCGRRAKTDDPRTWSSFDAVIAAWRAAPPRCQGVGYVFSPADPFAGIDLDGCLEADGAVKSWAQPIIAAFADGYMETSPSGKGVKIFTKAHLDGPGRRAAYQDGAVEVYDRGRFFTTTGQAFRGASLQVEDHQADVCRLYAAIAGGGTAQRTKAKADLKEQKTVSEGGRYAYLQSVVAQYRARGMDRDEIYAAAIAVNARRCKPPKPDAVVRELVDWVCGLQPGPRRVIPMPAPAGSEHQRPLIVVGGRELRDEADDCLAAIRAANEPPRFFVQSGRMFEVALNEKGRQVGREVTEPSLRGCLTRIADFRKKSAKGFVPCFPPRDVGEDLLALPAGLLGLPVLEGIVNVPVIREDGSIFAEPGYDRQSKLYYSPEPGFCLPAIPERPSSDHVEVAKGLINEMLEGFPFAEQSSRANAIALLLTPLARSVIQGPVPVANVTAPAPGHGKSLYADITAIISTGEPAEMYSMPRDGEELRKVLTTVLLSMCSVAVFDNVMGRVDSGDFAKAVTATTYADRAFRTHQPILVPVRCTWIVTGNNLRVGGDLPRRCFWIKFDAKTSRPEDRSDFKIPDLKAWVSARRPELVAALLTLARSWYAAGRPAAARRPLGSFESWSLTIGGILEHVGVTGFLDNASELRDESDSEAGQLERFLQVLREVFDGEPFSLGDVKKKMDGRVGNAFGGTELSSEAEEIRRALPDYLAEVSDRGGFFQRRAGKLFAEHCGRRFGDGQIYLCRDGISHHAQMWAIGSGS
jgi:hypothetical protein